jgi:arylsulfatase A
MMKKQIVIKALGISIFFVIMTLEKTNARSTQKDGKPNFIIIFTDDQGYGDVGCYGNKNLRTPNLDKMAAEGTRFTDFYMAAAVCTPSRAALLTGCYPQRVGLPAVLFPNSMSRGQRNGMAVGLNPEEITIARLLQSQGYQTSCIGKWHLGDLPEFMPLNHGFDEYFGLPYSNDMMPGTTTQYDFDPLPLYDGRKVIETNPDQDFLTMRYTEKAIDFIRRNKDAPFFLYLAHSMPHRPCHASNDFAKKWFSDQQLADIRGEEKEPRDFLYPATIEELDWTTGEILNTLKELNLDSMTLVIFTSDNGPAVGSSGPLRGRKGSMYEGGIRVPCIMKWSGTVPEGSICKQIIASIDLYPTLAALAGSNLPDDRVIDGVNILNCLLGKEEAKPRKTFYYLDQERGVRAVRHENWKLFPGAEARLFNLKNDIGEAKNLAGEYPELVKQLTEKTEKFHSELENNKREPGLILIRKY